MLRAGANIRLQRSRACRLTARQPRTYQGPISDQRDKALFAALLEGHGIAARLLFDNNPQDYLQLGLSESDLENAIQSNYTNVEMMLLEIKLDTGPQAEDLCHMLRRACETGNILLMERLLAKGLDVDRCDVGEPTLLYVAAENGYVSIAKSLLQHGIDRSALGLTLQAVIGNILEKHRGSWDYYHKHGQSDHVGI